MYWDDRYGTETVSHEVLGRMKQLMVDNNTAASHSFLLDDDSSIPFSLDDISNLMEDKVKCATMTCAAERLTLNMFCLAFPCLLVMLRSADGLSPFVMHKVMPGADTIPGNAQCSQFTLIWKAVCTHCNIGVYRRCILMTIHFVISCRTCILRFQCPGVSKIAGTLSFCSEICGGLLLAVMGSQQQTVSVPSCNCLKHTVCHTLRC